MEGLTPASADDLPPLGELLVDDPFRQYPAWGLAREGVGHLRIWAAATGSPGYLAVVTDTDGITSVTESAGRIWADLARRYGPSVVLLEHHLAPGSGEGAETLDLVRIGADGSPHWTRAWPTRKTVLVTPRSRSGWPTTGTRSSTGPRVGSTGARTRAIDRRGEMRKPGQQMTGSKGYCRKIGAVLPAAMAIASWHGSGTPEIRLSRGRCQSPVAFRVGI
jgi:hypothetical protein